MADDNNTPDWRESLPEDLRAAPALKDITDVSGLAKSFVDTQAFLGTAIRPPGPEASDEQKADFYRKIQEHAPDLIPRPNPEDAEQTAALYKALGRPEEAAGYVAPQVPEGSIPVDEARFNAFREVAHEAGLTQAQLEKIAGAEIAAATEAHNREVADIKQSQLDLQREWGLTFEDRVKSVHAFAAQTGAPKELVEAVAGGMVGADTLKWLHSLREAVGSEGVNVANQEGQGDGGALAPAEAMARAVEIMDQMLKLQPSDPRYADLMKKRLDYLKMADPKAQASIDGLRADATLEDIQQAHSGNSHAQPAQHGLPLELDPNAPRY